MGCERASSCCWRSRGAALLVPGCVPAAGCWLLLLHAGPWLPGWDDDDRCYLCRRRCGCDGAMARWLLSVPSSLLLTCTSAIALHVQQQPEGSGDRVALAVAAPTGTAAIATSSCSTFHSKLSCDLHPLVCQWSRPHRLCQPKAAPASPAPPPPPARSANRTVVWWLEPYANLTSVDAYSRAWRQFQQNKRPGYIMAGSAYALKPNGSLGYADTAAGEGLEGELMERCGFPALKRMGLTTIAMVYVTHQAAIQKMLANPAPFIAQLVAKAEAVGLDGQICPQPR
jgi:hypothetical protein